MGYRGWGFLDSSCIRRVQLLGKHCSGGTQMHSRDRLRRRSRHDMIIMWNKPMLWAMRCCHDTLGATIDSCDTLWLWWWSSSLASPCSWASTTCDSTGRGKARRRSRKVSASEVDFQSEVQAHPTRPLAAEAVAWAAEPTPGGVGGGHSAACGA